MPVEQATLKVNPGSTPAAPSSARSLPGTYEEVQQVRWPGGPNGPENLTEVLTHIFQLMCPTAQELCRSSDPRWTDEDMIPRAFPKNTIYLVVHCSQLNPKSSFLPGRLPRPLAIRRTVFRNRGPRLQIPGAGRWTGQRRSARPMADVSAEAATLQINSKAFTRSSTGNPALQLPQAGGVYNPQPGEPELQSAARHSANEVSQGVSEAPPNPDPPRRGQNGEGAQNSEEQGPVGKSNFC